MLKHTHLFDSIFENLEKNTVNSFAILIKSAG
jgi:hypothetical protein